MPASRFLKYTGKNWPNPVCSFYLPVSTSRDDPVVWRNVCQKTTSCKAKGREIPWASMEACDKQENSVMHAPQEKNMWAPTNFELRSDIIFHFPDFGHHCSESLFDEIGLEFFAFFYWDRTSILFRFFLRWDCTFHFHVVIGHHSPLFSEIRHRLTLCAEIGLDVSLSCNDRPPFSTFSWDRTCPHSEIGLQLDIECLTSIGHWMSDFNWTLNVRS